MLSVANLSLLRGDRYLCNGINFCVNSGQVLEIVGANGSGKSSLIKAMCGLLSLESGEVRWRQQVLFSAANEATVSECYAKYKKESIYVGHVAALHPALTALENLKFLASLSHRASCDKAAIDLSKGACLSIDKRLSMPKTQTQLESELIYGALERMQIAECANVTCAKLSAGQKQRISLARLLLATDKKLWLLDEPLANLDMQGIELVREIIEQHIQQNNLVVMATHNCLLYSSATKIKLELG